MHLTKMRLDFNSASTVIRQFRAVNMPCHICGISGDLMSQYFTQFAYNLYFMDLFYKFFKDLNETKKKKKKKKKKKNFLRAR